MIIKAAIFTTSFVLAQLAPPAVFVPPMVPPAVKSPEMSIQLPQRHEAGRRKIEQRLILMLATSAEDGGQVDTAIDMYKRVIDLGAGDAQSGYDSAIACGRLGALYADLQDFEPALKYAGMALKLFQRVQGPRSSDVGVELNNIAWIDEQRGEQKEAVKHYREALRVMTTATGENDDILAVTYNNLGDLYSEQFDERAALRCYVAADRFSARFYGRQHPVSQLIHTKLVQTRKRLAAVKSGKL